MRISELELAEELHRDDLLLICNTKNNMSKAVRVTTFMQHYQQKVICTYCNRPNENWRNGCETCGAPLPYREYKGGDPKEMQHLQ